MSSTPGVTTGHDQSWQNWQQFFSLPSSESEIDLRELLRKLWRRRRIVIGTTLLLTTLSVLVSFQLQPMYRATALVMVEPRESQVRIDHSEQSGGDRFEREFGFHA